MKPSTKTEVQFIISYGGRSKKDRKTKSFAEAAEAAAMAEFNRLQSKYHCSVIKRTTTISEEVII